MWEETKSSLNLTSKSLLNPLINGIISVLEVLTRTLEKEENVKIKTRLFCLAVALAMAVTIPAMAFAGTITGMDETTDNAMLWTSGGIPPVEIVAGLTTAEDFTRITTEDIMVPATMSAEQSPAQLSPQEINCNNCHTITAIAARHDEQPVTQTMMTMRGEGSSGGNIFHAGKALAVTPMMQSAPVTAAMLTLTKGSGQAVGMVSIGSGSITLTSMIV